MRYLLVTATAMMMAMIGCGGGRTPVPQADLAETADMALYAPGDMALYAPGDMARKLPDLATPSDMTPSSDMTILKSPTMGPCTHSSDCANFPPPSIPQNASTSALCVQLVGNLPGQTPLCSLVTYVLTPGTGGAEGQICMFATLPTWFEGQEGKTDNVCGKDAYGNAIVDITTLVGTTLAFTSQAGSSFGFVVQPN
jgi:hypothetical protein